MITYLYKTIKVFEFDKLDGALMSELGKEGYRIIYSEPIIRLTENGRERIGTGFVLEKVVKHDETV